MLFVLSAHKVSSHCRHKPLKETKHASRYILSWIHNPIKSVPMQAVLAGNREMTDNFHNGHDVQKQGIICLMVSTDLTFKSDVSIRQTAKNMPYRKEQAKSMSFDDLAVCSRNKAPALPGWVKDSPSGALGGNSVLCGGGDTWGDTFKSVFQGGK